MIEEADLEAVHEWDRREGEPAKAYAAFRLYRDLPIPQRVNVASVAEAAGFSERRCRGLATEWQWRERAEAWDDACHRTEDVERLEAIRQMHAFHRQTGRAALVKAAQALQLLSPEDIGPAHIARLLDLGARLERSTLIVSVEELQGIEAYESDADDPWERIARELDPNSTSTDE